MHCLDTKELFMSMVPRGTLRVESLRPHLAIFGIKIGSYHAVPWHAPQREWIKSLHLHCTRPGTLRAKVYVETLCAGFDGLPCEVYIKSVVAVRSTDRIGGVINRLENTQVLL